MDKLAKQQACQLWIEQQIDGLISMGQKPADIGRQIAEEVNRIFSVCYDPRTIEQRARRVITPRKPDKPATQVATPKVDQKCIYYDDPDLSGWPQTSKEILDKLHFYWALAKSDKKIMLCFLEYVKWLNNKIFSQVAAHSDRGKDVLDKMQQYNATSGECPNRKDDTCPWVEELQAWANYLDSWEMDLHEREDEEDVSQLSGPDFKPKERKQTVLNKK
jgi:hypothetical protein